MKSAVPLIGLLAGGLIAAWAFSRPADATASRAPGAPISSGAPPDVAKLPPSAMAVEAGPYQVALLLGDPPDAVLDQIHFEDAAVAQGYFEGIRSQVHSRFTSSGGMIEFTGPGLEPRTYQWRRDTLPERQPSATPLAPVDDGERAPSETAPAPLPPLVLQPAFSPGGIGIVPTGAFWVILRTGVSGKIQDTKRFATEKAATLYFKAQRPYVMTAFSDAGGSIEASGPNMKPRITKWLPGLGVATLTALQGGG